MLSRVLRAPMVRGMASTRTAMRQIGPGAVRRTHQSAPIQRLNKVMHADGLPIVMDRSKSKGSWVFDTVRQSLFLNYHGGYGSNCLGENHPSMTPEVIQKVGLATTDKMAHADIYTTEFIEAVDKIGDLYMSPSGFKKAFFIDGGALADVNACKIAIRNKVLTNIKNGKGEKGKTIIGFEGAFHGREGWTMTLSRTDPKKAQYMPKMDWPSAPVPNSNDPNDVKASLEALEAIVAKDPDEVAAVIIEPIQCEGGDVHFSPAFFQGIRELADKHNFYVIYDEVQTGFYASGAPFCFERMGFPKPDLVTGAKKSSAGYVFAAQSILDVPGNAFEVSGKINSTWGGHGGDMLVMAEKCQVISDQKLDENVRAHETRFLAGLSHIANRFPEQLSQPRCVGALGAINVSSEALRDKILEEMFDNQLLALAANNPQKGVYTIRFRPNLNVTETETKACLGRFSDAVRSAINGREIEDVV